MAGNLRGNFFETKPLLRPPFLLVVRFEWVMMGRGSKMKRLTMTARLT